MKIKASKIVLGTAQFGLDYGVSNPRGKIPEIEVRQILEKAFEAGIEILDTAIAYGDAQRVIGKATDGHLPFKVISKLPPVKNPSDIPRMVKESLELLKINSLYGLLIHNFDWYFEEPKVWNIIQKLQAEGLIEKIGFSLYSPEQLKKLLSDSIITQLVQLPTNVFDQRFKEIFSLLKKQGIEIHVRSAFLQGLFFLKTEKISAFFNPIKSKIEHLQLLAKKNGLPLSALLLSYCLLNPQIDRVVIGIENLQNLEENLKTFSHLEKAQKLLPSLDKMAERNEAMIDPTKWETSA